MILGIGTDLVENCRLERWLASPGLLRRYFTEIEIHDISESAHPVASLAARFAAKEAFGKALGTGLAGFLLREIETRRGHAGQPALFLNGHAKEVIDGRRARVHLSLSHERDYSLAFVVLEAV